MSEGLSFRRPGGLRGPRLAPMIVAAVIVAAVGAMTWWITPSAPGGLVVEVRGDVPNPGFHRIEHGDLRHALQAAGHPGAASATPLHEGDLVRVQPEGILIHPTGNPLLYGLPIDLNDAGPEALEAVPGVGPSLAEAILQDRAANGPFYAVTDLARVEGVGPATVEELGPLLTVGDIGPRPATGPLDLNMASAAQLERLPGIGPVLAARIVVDRAEHGPFDSLRALDRVPGIGPATLRELDPLVTASPASSTD